MARRGTQQYREDVQRYGQEEAEARADASEFDIEHEEARRRRQMQKEREQEQQRAASATQDPMAAARERERQAAQARALGRAAPTVTAAQVGPAQTAARSEGQIDRSQLGADGFRTGQEALVAQLQAQARGEGPSLAQSQLRQATDRNLSQL